jgi:large subunit ribosomal protein L30
MASKKKPESKSGKTLRIQYVRSAIGTPGKHRLIIKGLGFKRLNQIVVREDTPAIRGMVAQAPHLVKIISEQQ